jgi:hypothetical protein
VHPPFNSSHEEEGFKPEPDRGRKRKRRAPPKQADADFELGWKEKIHKVQKPAFSDVPGINTNVNIPQNSYPMDIFEICFSPEVFILMLEETNQYTTQQINIKNQEGLLTPNSVCAQWHTVSFTSWLSSGRTSVMFS